MPRFAVVYLLVSCLAWSASAEEPNTPGVNLMEALRIGHPLIKFTKSTTTVTQTQRVTEWIASVLCAKLVNVTGPCFQRRGIFVEEPVVLTFDDDIDADPLMMLKPTKTLRY